MENFVNQMRAKFTGVEENKADHGGSNDQKVPIQKTQSFKEKKKGQTWFPKFARKMSEDYESKEAEHAAAVAAAAFAIDSQPELQNPEAPLSKTKSKLDGTKSLLGSASKRFSGSFRSTDEQGNKVQTSSSSRDAEKAITPAPTGTATGHSEADAWERTELEKIRERYEKLKETIDSWEKKKKLRATRKLNMEESEIERRRLKALEIFQSNMKHIDEIAMGARSKAEERRRDEELKAIEKANEIRKTGRLPGIWSCF